MRGWRAHAFKRTKRTKWAVAGAALAIGATFVVTSPAAGQVDFNNGTGQASALGYKVNPTFGNLSFGITAGVSVAGHQNTVAQGISEMIDLGVIGTTLAGEGCDGGDPTLAAEDQPQPVIAESTDPGAEDGIQQDENWGGVPSGRKYAMADDRPFAEAVTTVTPLGDAAVAEISGGRTIASSGVVDGNVREARAVTEIASVRLLGDTVRIGDMRWEAIHRSGAVEETTGNFEIGSLTVAGEQVALPGDPAGQLEALDEALNMAGFTLTPPAVRVEQGIVFVDAMKIGIIPSELRESVLGPVFGEIQPYREALAQALLEQDCGNATYITVLDIALGTFSGAGALKLELGGVQATTREIVGFRGLGQFTPRAPVTNLPPVPTAPVGAAAPVATPAPAPADEPAAAPPRPRPEAAAPIADLVGSRGGALAVVSGVGLAALLAAMEADRRAMRRSARAIAMEV